MTRAAKPVPRPVSVATATSSGPIDSRAQDPPAAGVGLMRSVRIVVLSLVVVGLLPAGGHWEAGRDEPIRPEHRGSAPPTTGPARSSAQPISAQYFARLFQYQLARRGNHPNPLDTGSTVILNVGNARESVLTDPATWQRKTEYYQGGGGAARPGQPASQGVERGLHTGRRVPVDEQSRRVGNVRGVPRPARCLGQRVDWPVARQPRRRTGHGQPAGRRAPGHRPPSRTRPPHRASPDRPRSNPPPPPSIRECLVRRHEQ